MLGACILSTRVFFTTQRIVPRSSFTYQTTYRQNRPSDAPLFTLSPKSTLPTNEAKETITSLKTAITHKDLVEAQKHFTFAIESGISSGLYTDFFSLLENVIINRYESPTRLLNSSLNYYEAMIRNDVNIDIRLYSKLMNIAKITSTKHFTTLFS
jgi:hypothetical protein